MLRKNPVYTVLLAVTVLSGCAGLKNDRGPEDYAYVTPKPGSEVVVNQPLTAKSGARITMQSGKLVRWHRIASWRPYCQFFVVRPSGEISEPLRIEPDTFVVTRTYRSKDSVRMDGAGVQYAFVGEDFKHSPSQVNMATYLELHSDKQPDVRYLRCVRWADPYHYNHVSISEMRKALGDLVTLVAKTDGS